MSRNNRELKIVKKDDFILFLDIDKIKTIEDFVNAFKALQVQFSIVDSVIKPEHKYLFKKMQVNDKKV